MEGTNPFVSDTLNILGQAKDIMVFWAISAMRFIGLVFVMPLFKRTELSRAILAAVAFMFAAPIAGGLTPEIDTLPKDDFLFITILILKEVAIGMLLGVFFGVPFWAIEAAGEFADHQRSIGESGITDPATGEQSSVMAVLLNLVAITLFAVEGGISIMVETIYQSYQFWGVGRFLPAFSIEMLSQIVEIIGRILLFGLLVAAPIIFALLMSDFVVMALGRTSAKIQLVAVLPLIKNIIFCFFSIVYLEFLIGFMRDGVFETHLITKLLEMFGSL